MYGSCGNGIVKKAASAAFFHFNVGFWPFFDGGFRVYLNNIT